ncbi:MaoC family dehydratase N-terminal domain-containing protein [Streptomyces sp. NPDC019531]|uniref:FAS1-like dehydratase domain-containing protein n=1 Tax=Streptomyces sp. NPDC019531 TaxID=3365062 RepID=UPI00384C717F
MPLNRAYLGRVLQPAFEHRVTAQELIAFADALGESNPVCRDTEAAARYGYPAIVAAPTYVAALALRAERPLFDDPGFGADLESLRHLESGFTTHRPVHAGDALRCLVRVTSIDKIGNRELLTTVVSVTAVDVPVAEVRSVVVMLGR